MFVFDRTANATTYLDGQPVDSRYDSYLGAALTAAPMSTSARMPTGTFGAATATTADMDDLGVWRRALTQLEVSGMYLAGVGNSPG